MKVTTQQLEVIRSAVAPLDTARNRARYIVGDFPRADRVKDIDKRYRWDLLNATGWQIACSLYDAGCNDDHIDTALRTIVAPLGQGTA